MTSSSAVLFSHIFSACLFSLCAVQCSFASWWICCDCAWGSSCDTALLFSKRPADCCCQNHTRITIARVLQLAGPDAHSVSLFVFVFHSKFSHVPSLLSLCLHNLCHKELIDIISRARLYEPILLEVCACMSQIYLRAESKLMGKPSATATQDAASEHRHSAGAAPTLRPRSQTLTSCLSLCCVPSSVLVRTLSAYNSIPHLRLLVHLLTILQCLIRSVTRARRLAASNSRSFQFLTARFALLSFLRSPASRCPTTIACPTSACMLAPVSLSPPSPIRSSPRAFKSCKRCAKTKVWTSVHQFNTRVHD